MSEGSSTSSASTTSPIKLTKKFYIDGIMEKYPKYKRYKLQQLKLEQLKDITEKDIPLDEVWTKKPTHKEMEEELEGYKRLVSDLTAEMIQLRESNKKLTGMVRRHAELVERATGEDGKN